MIKVRVLLLLVVAYACWPSQAVAETSHTCAGYIDALPATISTQGVWCLRKDLATSIGNGNAITINNHNVTIDCNDFKIGGFGAGAGTNAVGIGSMQRNNITVRNCNVRGFWIGIDLAYNAGNTVPTTGAAVLNNRIDGSTRIGIVVASDGATIRGNTIVDTGGNTAAENAIAIMTHFGVDITDNLIDGVYPTGDSKSHTMGVLAWNNQGGVIGGNRIRNVIGNSSASGIGLTFDSLGVAVKDNVIYMPGTNATAIDCYGAGNVAVGNAMTGPAAAMTANCRDGGGNVLPLGF